jgi:5-carboxymethyl-2-hydroxymuconate isomerase
VRGYLCLNDVSARDLQFADGQWTRREVAGHVLPGRARMGAGLRGCPDPQALAIKAILNGEVMQDSSTRTLVFGVAEVIEFISQAITLENRATDRHGDPRRGRRLPRPAGLHAAGR